MKLSPKTAGVTVGLVATILFIFFNGWVIPGRLDFFYLADAFLHGRTWLTFQTGEWDVIPIDGRFYVPFAPFPALLFLPLVAGIGPAGAGHLSQILDAILAGASVGGMWLFATRIGVRRTSDRLFLALLLIFSTPLLWVTIRGSVWHQGQDIATLLTVLTLIELWGARRPLVVGLLAGADFLTRAPLAFALPVYALMLIPEEWWATARTRAGEWQRTVRQLPWRDWAWLTLGFVPALGVFIWYNQARFGDPLQTGYGLALLPDFLERQRELGLFSIAQVPRNLDYLLTHTPSFSTTYPFLKPDGFGMSLLITSPGLFFAIRADWRSRPVVLLGLATLLTLVPSLLYYGGGWVQFGFRYFLDSVPFAVALCGYAAVRREGIGPGWRILIVAGVVVGLISTYWATRI